MTELTKPIVRVTNSTIFQKSASRNLIVSIEPCGSRGALIGLRIKGTRQTYRVGVNSVFNLALRQHLSAIEQRIKQLRKAGSAAAIGKG